MINQAVFYFMSVHIKVILDKKKKGNNILFILISPQDYKNNK